MNVNMCILSLDNTPSLAIIIIEIERVQQSTFQIREENVQLIFFQMTIKEILEIRCSARAFVINQQK